jgi:hypothetical protein
MLKNIYKFLINFFQFIRTHEPLSKWLQIQKYHEPKTQNDRTKDSLETSFTMFCGTGVISV